MFQGMSDDEWRNGGESQTAGCKSQQTRNSLHMADRALVALLVEKNVSELWSGYSGGARYSHEDSREAKKTLVTAL